MPVPLLLPSQFRVKAEPAGAYRGLLVTKNESREKDFFQKRTLSIYLDLRCLFLLKFNLTLLEKPEITNYFI